MTAYSNEVAAHYDAFRPPLHRLILKSVLKDRRFRCGLDIGCGTGISTHALAQHCGEVVGLDPSEAMIERAVEEDGVRFQLFNVRDLPFPNGRFDLITFAGSLFYTDRSHIAQEVCRVALPGAWVLVYDFRIMLDNVSGALHIPVGNSYEYDHEASFDGLGIEKLMLIDRDHSSVRFSVSLEELAHLILSEEGSLSFLASEISGDVFQGTISALQARGFKAPVSLEAKTFSSLYHILE